MSALKFGILLPNSGSLANAKAIRQVAIKAEELGLDSVWVHDHISYGSDWLGHRASGLAEQITEAAEPVFHESVNTLSFVAGFTDRILLGTAMIVLPLRNPLVLGRQLITLQALSQGRLILGVAAGDYPAEFNVMNVPYETRGAITDEYLEVLCKILHGGSVSYYGKNVHFEDGQFYPKVNSPPVIVGGGVIAVPEPDDDKLSIPALRRAAKYGDGWMPDWGRPELIERGVKTIKDLARNYGKEHSSFQVAFSTAFHLADRDEDALRATAKSIEFAEREANVVAKYGVRTPRKTLERSLIGSRRTVAERIQEYALAGVSHFSLVPLARDIDSLLRMMEKFGKEVMTSF
jgi:alkanesulfonate monooxygenase SsuD/methylene tetrahydromethanopterin reductase-like flavin-dependent oxidoreductase (luciferase family)